MIIMDVGGSPEHSQAAEGGHDEVAIWMNAHAGKATPTTQPSQLAEMNLTAEGPVR